MGHELLEVGVGCFGEGLGQRNWPLEAVNGEI